MNSDEKDFLFVKSKDADADSTDLFMQAKAYHLGIGVDVDKAKAAELYRQAALQGNEKAKLNLAMMYLTQEGDLSNPKLGLEMLTEMSDEGNAYAMMNLGSCYLRGSFVNRDTEKGVSMIQKASEKGCPEATYALSAYYTNELGDTKRGMELLHQAADEDSVIALQVISSVYEQGMGPYEKDLNRSHNYLKRAAELGDAASQYKFGYLVLTGEIDSVSPKDCVTWFKKAALQGLPDAQYHLGICYIDNREGRYDIPQDFSAGIAWIRKAAQQGYEGAVKVLEVFGLEEEMTTDERTIALYSALKYPQDGGEIAFEKLKHCFDYNDPFAQYIFGIMKYEGNILDHEPDEGLRLLKLAADQGFVEAISTLGVLLNEEKRYEEANVYHRKGADMGDPHSIHNLGNAYFYGRGMTPDEGKAFQLWEQAANLGNVDSMTTLGKCYRDGKIVKHDVEKSVFYLTEAARRGHIPAIEILIEVYKSLGDDRNIRYWQSILEQPEN